jgi:hypothetical protein
VVRLGGLKGGPALGKMRGFIDANRNGVEERVERVTIAGVVKTKNWLLSTPSCFSASGTGIFS